MERGKDNKKPKPPKKPKKPKKGERSYQGKLVIEGVI